MVVCSSIAGPRKIESILWVLLKLLTARILPRHLKFHIIYWAARSVSVIHPVLRLICQWNINTAAGDKTWNNSDMLQLLNLNDPAA